MQVHRHTALGVVVLVATGVGTMPTTWGFGCFDFGHFVGQDLISCGNRIVSNKWGGGQYSVGFVSEYSGLSNELWIYYLDR